MSELEQALDRELGRTSTSPRSSRRSPSHDLQRRSPPLAAVVSAAAVAVVAATHRHHHNHSSHHHHGQQHPTGDGAAAAAGGRHSSGGGGGGGGSGGGQQQRHSSSKQAMTPHPDGSLFAAAAAKLPGARDAEGQLVTDGFLDVCQLVVPVIDQFGTAFAMVKMDINNNIERLRTRFLTNPVRFERLFSIIDEEVSRNDHDHGKSCTKGLLWLKRALEFMMAIMKQLLEAPEMPMADVVYEQYHATLHRWHGFLASSAFNVAFHFVPSREAFMEKVAGANDPGAQQAMAGFIASFSPLLAEVHTFLDSKGLDDPAKV